jgi:hypothetical protein
MGSPFYTTQKSGDDRVMEEALALLAEKKQLASNEEIEALRKRIKALEDRPSGDSVQDGGHGFGSPHRYGSEHGF